MNENEKTTLDTQKVAENKKAELNDKPKKKRLPRKNLNQSKPQKTLFEIGENGFQPVDSIKAEISSSIENGVEQNIIEKAVPKKRRVNELQVGQGQIEKELIAKNRTQKNKKLKVVFLGGVGEIGKNMTALEYEDDILVIDAGLTFPDNEMPGIDVVVPDITYLLCNKEKVKGVVLTHGHEDHIGGLPYFINEVNVPMYGSRMTMALVAKKLKEHPRIKYSANSVKPGQKVKIGCFEIEFIHVNHSIAGAMALSISTPVGQVVHTGDFKIDFCPISGDVTDMAKFAEIGRKGVQLLLCESTNVERSGYSMSESIVRDTLDRLYEQYKEKRLIIATFASNTYRLQEILDLAVKYKRKVAFSGRSMINVTETAMKVGELKYDKSVLIDIDKVNTYKPSEVVVVSTGSQGEPMSALSRMANDDFPKITIDENDCVILSSSPIPGNESFVYRVINKLYQKGASVIYHELASVHVSGHACQEELRTIHALIRPKFFIPVHGEYRHLKLHQQLAVSMGVPERNTVIADLGNVIEISHNSIMRAPDVTSGKRLVDGYGVGDMESVVLRDRKQLSVDGVCVALIYINNQGRLSRKPELMSRGFIYNDEQNEVVSEAKLFLKEALDNTDLKGMDKPMIKQLVKKTLTNFFFKKTKRKPLILTIIQ